MFNSKRRVIALSSIALLFICSFIISDSAIAKVGYVLNVDVDGTQYHREQSTTVLDFRSDSNCQGVGNFSRYVNVAGFVGNSLKENTYAKKGVMIAKDKLNVTSEINWIYITENVNGQPYNTSINESTNIVRRADHYYAEINESIPTLIRNSEEIAYRGSGIYSRNSFTSDNDTIYTDYFAKNFTKVIGYASAFANSQIYVDIYPGQIYEKAFKNTASAFRVLSRSDSYSRLGYTSDDKIIDNEFRGSSRIDESITRRNKFNLSQDLSWLECCDWRAPIITSNEYWVPFIYGQYYDPGKS